MASDVVPAVQEDAYLVQTVKCPSLTNHSFEDLSPNFNFSSDVNELQYTVQKDFGDQSNLSFSFCFLLEAGVNSALFYLFIYIFYTESVKHVITSFCWKCRKLPYFGGCVWSLSRDVLLNQFQ